MKQERPARPDALKAGAAKAGGTPGPAALADLVRELTLRQQRYEKRLSAALGTDVAGLEVLSHLMSASPAAGTPMVDSAAATPDLTPPDLTPPDLTPTELARHLGLSTAATSLVLNRLEAAGHVTRERHPSDGRKLVVRVTAPSAERAARQVAPLIQGVERLLSELDEEQRRTIGDVLERVIACYDDHYDELPKGGR